MVLFSIHGEELKKVHRLDFRLERDIQNVTEHNMDIIFGLDFVKSEFQLNNLRIDSLAYDEETNSFVIIEYKRDKNFSVIDQGYAYLALLLNNKADFILEYNERKENFLKKNDVDWSQSRVIFIAPQFTKYQQQAIEFKDLPIELWEISKYTNNTILFNQLKSPDTSESINTVSSKSDVVKEVGSVVKKYTEDDHFKLHSEEIKELYEDIKKRIFDLGDNVEIKPLKVLLHLNLTKLLLMSNLRKIRSNYG